MPCYVQYDAGRLSSRAICTETCKTVKNGDEINDRVSDRGQYKIGAVKVNGCESCSK